MLWDFLEFAWIFRCRTRSQTQHVMAGDGVGDSCMCPQSKLYCEGLVCIPVYDPMNDFKKDKKGKTELKNSTSFFQWWPLDRKNQNFDLKFGRNVILWLVQQRAYVRLLSSKSKNCSAMIGRLQAVTKIGNFWFVFCECFCWCSDYSCIPKLQHLILILLNGCESCLRLREIHV